MIRVSLVRFVQISLSLNFSSLVIRMRLSSWNRMEIVHVELHLLLFKKQRESQSALAPAVTLTQNSQSARAVEFGMTCP